jgi:membrane protein YqaA with SNARE-associated domain
VNIDKWLSGWRLNVIRIFVLLGVIAITVFVFSIRDQAEQLQGYGYPGIFVLSILSNATLILPAPGIALTFAFGAVFNPIGVALAAGAGSAIGELTGYLAGFSGQGVIEQTAMYDRLEGWTDQYGGWTIMILALIPNPLFDLAGAAAGALKMPIFEFLLWAFIGKTIKMLLFAYAGSTSLDWLVNLMGG